MEIMSSVTDADLTPDGLKSEPVPPMVKVADG
jgi:hypothetical protein